MHEFTPEVEELAKEILDYSLIRLRTDPPLDGPKTAQELYELAGNTITASGLGGHETLKLFKEVLATACISTDHPRYLAFIPSAHKGKPILRFAIVNPWTNESDISAMLATL